MTMKYVVVFAELDESDPEEGADPQAVTTGVRLCADKEGVEALITHCEDGLDWSVWEILADGRTAQRSVTFKPDGRGVESIQ